MTWSWRFNGEDGTPNIGLPKELAPSGFASQADAETWLGENWRALRDEGVDSVELREHGLVVYGPMSLTKE